MRSRWAILLVSFSLTALGCDSCSASPAAGDAGAAASTTTSAPSGMAALLAVPEARRSEVLAKIGDRVITLGEVIDVISQVPPADRERAATREGRRAVLDRLVRDALLAAEARRLGLDDKPELRDAARSLLAEALLAEERAKLPTLAGIDESEAKRFYDEHRDRYSHPELRRAEVLAFTDRSAAVRALAEPPKDGWTDLGEISAKGHVASSGYRSGGVRHRDEGPTATVTAPVTAALFALAEVGNLHPSVVEAEGKHYVVRLAGITAGRERTFEEVSQVVRTDYLQEQWAVRERALEKEARERFPVSIDDKALERVEPPEWLDDVAKSRSRPKR